MEAKICMVSDVSVICGMFCACVTVCVCVCVLAFTAMASPVRHL